MKRKIFSFLVVGTVAVLVVLGVNGRNSSIVGEGPTVPETWRGTWEVRVAYSDRETGELVATDVTTAAICPGEPIMPPLLGTLLRCSGEATGDGIDIFCSAKHSPQRGCNAFVEAKLNSKREGDVWNGNGSWNASVVGKCEHTKLGQNFVVTGRRVSSEAACNGTGASLVQRFFVHSELVPVLGGGN